LKSLQLGQKNLYTIGAKEDMTVKEIIIIKKKPSVFHQYNRKDASRVHLELAGPHSSQDLRYKIINSFERHSLEKRVPLEHLACKWLPKKVFLLLGTQGNCSKGPSRSGNCSRLQQNLASCT
jgi:hypothetical protein